MSYQPVWPGSFPPTANFGCALAHMTRRVIVRDRLAGAIDVNGRRRARNRSLRGAARWRLAVGDPHVREFDQTRQLRERIFGLRLLSARGAQSPLEFVEVNLVHCT